MQGGQHSHHRDFGPRKPVGFLWVGLAHEDHPLRLPRLTLPPRGTCHTIIYYEPFSGWGGTSEGSSYPGLQVAAGCLEDDVGGDNVAGWQGGQVHGLTGRSADPGIHNGRTPDQVTNSAHCCKMQLGRWARRGVSSLTGGKDVVKGHGTIGMELWAGVDFLKPTFVFGRVLGSSGHA